MSFWRWSPSLSSEALLQSPAFFTAITTSDGKKGSLYHPYQWPEVAGDERFVERPIPALAILEGPPLATASPIEVRVVADDVLEEITAINAGIRDRVRQRLPRRESGSERLVQHEPLRSLLPRLSTQEMHRGRGFNRLQSPARLLDSESGPQLGNTLAEEYQVSDPRLDDVALLSLRAMQDVEPAGTAEREEFWEMLCLRMSGVTLEHMGRIFGSSKRMLWYRMANIEEKIVARMKYLLAVDSARSGESWRLAGCAHGAASPVACVAGCWEVRPDEGNPLTPLWDEFIRTL